MAMRAGCGVPCELIVRNDQRSALSFREMPEPNDRNPSCRVCAPYESPVPSEKQPVGPLTDGDRALQILVEGTLCVTLILDLLHVLEKLWKSAYLFHAEGSLEADSGFWAAPCESCLASSRMRHDHYLANGCPIASGQSRAAARI